MMFCRWWTNFTTKWDIYFKGKMSLTNHLKYVEEGHFKVSRTKHYPFNHGWNPWGDGQTLVILAKDVRIVVYIEKDTNRVKQWTKQKPEIIVLLIQTEAFWLWDLLHLFLWRGKVQLKKDWWTFYFSEKKIMVFIKRSGQGSFWRQPLMGWISGLS